MKKCLLSSAGTTLLELSIAMLVGSFVISAAYKSHQYLTRSTEREKVKALIQRDIISVNEQMCRDIRMSGLGLPGNGIIANLSDISSDELQVFSNENKSSAKLSVNLCYDDIKIFVDTLEGAAGNGWVCIAGEGIDTIYCQMIGTGYSPAGPDTVYLNGIVGAGTFQPSAAELYYCTRTLFRINKNESSCSFIVQKNETSVELGGYIDTFNIMLKSISGTVLSGDFKNAAVLTILTGGYVGSGSNRNLISETTDINIRNRD